MFPIRDPRGRCIAFGGRAMSPEARAKYLNSPETELFHKGRTLYNHGPAREAAGKAGTVIVTEGYMDVIALVAGRLRPRRRAARHGRSPRSSWRCSGAWPTSR